MAQSYAEYLKSMGASDEDIKILVNPKSETAYNKMVTDLEAATTRAAAAEKAKQDYDKWYTDELTPSVQKIYTESATLKGEKAKLEAQLKAMQDYGLAQVAAGGDGGNGAGAGAGNGNAAAGAGTLTAEQLKAAGFDPAKYVDRDTLLQVAEKEGDAIAIMADIAEEHRELFGTRLNARDLRKEAVAQKKSVEQLWMEKYKVPEARAKREAEQKSAYEKKIADDAVAKYKSENSSTNPFMGPGAPSKYPLFNKRSGGDGKVVNPWDKQGDLSRDRVEKVVQKLAQSGT